MKGLCACLCLLAVVSAGGQQNAPEMDTQESQPTFKSGVNLVLVPVVVRDGQGHAVGNLKRADFQLFDKGKLQTISRFSVESHVMPEAAGKPAATETPVATDGARPRVVVLPERYVAYVFDDLHTQFGDLARVQKAALNHVATELQPFDRAAIYTTSGQGNLDFTDDRAKLNEAISKLRVRPMLRQQANDCPYMTYYLADQIMNKNNQDLLQTMTNDTIACAGLQGPGAQQQAQQMVQSTAQSFLPMGDQDTRVTLSVLKDIVRRMTALPGQRTVVIASPGFMTLTYESFEMETEILDRAARANVVISAIDARGLYTDSTFDASQQGSATPLMSIKKQQYLRESDSVQANILAEFADGTGGTFVQNSNDLAGGFHRVAAAPEYVYMLGFSPQNLKMNGSFHKLKVTLAETKGLSVQARRGYYAPNHLASPEETAKEEIRDAVFSREELHDIPVDLHTQFFKPDPADAKLTVLARVDLKHIHFKKLDGRNRNDLTIVAALFDRNGNYVTGVSKTLEMRLKDETLQRLNAPITVRSSFDVKPGTYMVRVVVRDTEGQLMSAQNGSVDIP